MGDFQIRLAKPKDAKTIFEIQNKNLLGDLRKMDKRTQEAMRRRGFLLDALPREHIEGLIRLGGENGTEGASRVWVAQNGAVVGYALAYDLAILQKEAPQALATLQIEPVYQAELEGKRVLYLEQIALDPNRGRSQWVGSELMLALAEDAYAQGYGAIVDLVLSAPIENTCSLRFHDRLGFDRIGLQRRGEYEWAVLAHPLDGFAPAQSNP